jgi:hypothetical protein
LLQACLNLLLSRAQTRYVRHARRTSMSSTSQARLRDPTSSLFARGPTSSNTVVTGSMMAHGGSSWACAFAVFNDKRRTWWDKVKVRAPTRSVTQHVIRDHRRSGGIRPGSTARRCARIILPSDPLSSAPAFLPSLVDFESSSALHRASSGGTLPHSLGYRVLRRSTAASLSLLVVRLVYIVHGISLFSLPHIVLH